MLCWFVLLGSNLKDCGRAANGQDCDRETDKSWLLHVVWFCEILLVTIMDPDPGLDFSKEWCARWSCGHFFLPHSLAHKVGCFVLLPHTLSNCLIDLAIQTAKKALTTRICRQVLHVHLWKRAWLAWKRWIAFCCCSLLLVHPYAVIQRTLVTSKDKSFVTWFHLEGDEPKNLPNKCPEISRLVSYVLGSNSHWFPW